MIQAVIFDFDGTLFDTTAAICEAFNGALKADGRAPIDERRIGAMIGRPLVDMFRQEDPAADLTTIERRVARYRQRFLPACVKASKPMPGLHDCLRALRRRRLRLAIATNRKADGAVRILRGFHLRRYFPVIIGIDEVPRHKPWPDPIFEALRRLHVSPCTAVMVGDTPDDICAGCAAGVRTFGVTTDAHRRSTLLEAGAEAVLASLKELPNRLEG